MEDLRGGTRYGSLRSTFAPSLPQLITTSADYRDPTTLYFSESSIEDDSFLQWGPPLGRRLERLYLEKR